MLPGTTYLISRRCTQRQLLLEPSEATNEVFKYVLALSASRHGIQVHAVCVMSNHFHLVATDPDGVLPAFLQLLNGFVARAMNKVLHRWESFWAPSSYNAVTLATPQDILDKVAYTLANPVAAGLVTRARDWGGVWTAPKDIDGGRIEASRPDTFFRTRGGLPDVATLELTPPPGFDSARDFVENLESALASREQAALLDSAPGDLDFRPAPPSEGNLGARRRKSSEEASKGIRTPATPAPRRNLRPRFAARDRETHQLLASRLRQFLCAYREAWAAFKKGSEQVVFPEGTYWMRVAHGVACGSG